jgi:hypothetical protein
LTDAPVTPAPAAPALGISFRSILGTEGRREIIFQTHVDQEVPASQLNEVLDKLTTAVDRQAAIAELVEIRKNVEHATKEVAAFEAALEQMDAVSQLRWESSDKKGPWDPSKLPPNQQADRKNTKLGLEKNRATVLSLRERIAELEALVNVDAPVSSADSDPRLSNL